MVRFAGEPVAVVVAADRYVARDAADAIVVQYDPLPAVVAVSDAINEPRYPSLKGIMGAKSKPQETLSAGDLGLDAGDVGEAGSKTTVLELGPPPSRGDTVKIEDDGSGAQKILDYAVERRLL